MITYKYLGRRGRFGNQLFQYATLFAIAKENNYEFGIPYKTRNDDEYMDMCLADCFLNLSAKDASNYTPIKQIQEVENKFESKFLKIPDGVDIFGYFQTEKYFKKYKNELLKEFTFKDIIKKKCTNLKNSLNNTLISVHMRFGDYEKLSDIYPRPTTDYYNKAFEILPKNSTILLFSDDLNKASLYFKEVGKNFKIFENLNKYEDMCLMSLCDYHIIANSSFSWWGAWLSNSQKVIAPAKWYGSSPNAPKYWGDIYCEGWETI